MASVFDVAAYILQRQGAMTTWKLQKLVYYTRLLHKPKDPLLPRSSQEQTPRKFVIPAKAGIHFNHESLWIPAFAGMTGQDDHFARVAYPHWQ